MFPRDGLAGKRVSLACRRIQRCAPGGLDGLVGYAIVRMRGEYETVRSRWVLQRVCKIGDPQSPGNSAFERSKQVIFFCESRMQVDRSTRRADEKMKRWRRYCWHRTIVMRGIRTNGRRATRRLTSFRRVRVACMCCESVIGPTSKPSAPDGLPATATFTDLAPGAFTVAGSM